METRQHHRAKIEFKIVEKCRDMREYDGLQIKDIAKWAGVPYWTVVDWVFYRTRIYK